MRQSFGSSLGNSYLPLFLVIIALRFTCRKRKVWHKHQKLSKNYENYCLKNFILVFIMALVTAVFFKNSNI